MGSLTAAIGLLAALGLAGCGAGVATPGAARAAGADPLVRVSTTPAGVQGDKGSSSAAVSADGTVVAFGSAATNLVPGDTNGADDLFVKNIATGAITRVDGGATMPALSADGTTVAFAASSHLVPGNPNEVMDVFVKDLGSGTLTRVSTSAAGAAGTGHSGGPSLSADGSKVAFYSDAANLVPGDTNKMIDVFVKDLRTGAITRASVAKDAAQAVGSDSYDPDHSGKFWVRHRTSLSADGASVAFASTGNLTRERTAGLHIFVKDLSTGAVTLASALPTGAKGADSSWGPALSADGTAVAFTSWTPNLVKGDTNRADDVFVRNLTSGTIVRASTDAKGAQANDTCAFPSLSQHGDKVTFSTRASNLVKNDTNGTEDVFVKNLKSGAVVRGSLGSGGAEGDRPSSEPALSPDGRYVVFTSYADNLTQRDTNGVGDAFLARLP